VENREGAAPGLMQNLESKSKNPTVQNRRTGHPKFNFKARAARGDSEVHLLMNESKSKAPAFKTEDWGTRNSMSKGRAARHPEIQTQRLCHPSGER
jgi:hypothetical protein